MLLCRQNVSEKAYFRLYLSLDLMFYLTGKQCKGETSVPLIKFCVNATVCLFFNLVFFLRICKIPGSNQGGDTASQVLPCRATWCGVQLRIRDHYCPKRCTELGQTIILYIAGLRFFISVSLILHHALHPSPVSHPSSCYIFISPGSMQSH